MQNRSLQSKLIWALEKWKTTFILAGPKNWKKKQATWFQCSHDFIPLMTYLVVPQSYSELSEQVTRDKINGQ